VKNFDDMFTRFDTIHERNRQSAGYRATAGRAYASRGKNYFVIVSATYALKTSQYVTVLGRLL